MNDSVIQTSALTKRYGHILAVDQLTLEVPRGRIFGLLGPNGSGKTTTIGMLLGLVRPTSGSFSLLGSRMSHAEALHRVGAIVEQPYFIPISRDAATWPISQGISGRGSPQELDDLLEQVGLADRAGDRFQTYSLGMKQRLGLAYTLLGNPELLILDEPTNGMDPAGMAEVRDLIRSLGSADRTVLLSSHLLNEVEQICDSVAILSKGKVIAQAPSATCSTSKNRSDCEPQTTRKPSKYSRRWSGWTTCESRARHSS